MDFDIRVIRMLNKITLAFTLFSECMMCCFFEHACLYGDTERSGISCDSPASTSTSV